MAKVNQKGLKAFTIVETLVSLTLITIAIGMGFLMFNNTAIDLLKNKEAGLLADALLQEIKVGDRALSDQNVKWEEYEAEIIVDLYEQLPTLNHLQIIIYKDDKAVYELNDLIIGINEN